MLRKNRNATSFLQIRPDYDNFTPLSINDSSQKEKELWMILEQLSEIKENRNRFVQKFNLDKKTEKRVSKNFQSFVRQAKNYYFSAKNLPNSSSALLYYYSFLNLSKAILIFHHPKEISKKIQHGLYCREKRSSVFKNEIIRSDNGVFKILYEYETKELLNNQTAFNINTLFGYCNDISYQYSEGGFGNNLNAVGSMVMSIDNQRKKSWLTLAIYKFDVVNKYKKRLFNFYKNYEKISLDKSMSKEYFNMNGQQAYVHNFFEGNEYNLSGSGAIPIPTILGDFANHTKGLLVPCHYKMDNSDFYFSRPYSLKKQILMNEFLSIYIIMFYLSHLVRYQPYYLDRLLDTRESWIINAFIESCPQTFLIYAISKITGKNFMLLVK